MKTYPNRIISFPTGYSKTRTVYLVETDDLLRKAMFKEFNKKGFYFDEILEPEKPEIPSEIDNLPIPVKTFIEKLEKNYQRLLADYKQWIYTKSLYEQIKNGDLRHIVEFFDLMNEDYNTDYLESVE